MGYSRKELRFWSNWTLFILTAPLYSTSLYSISSSFHQFVTNPTADEIEQDLQLGRSNITGEEIEPGLGESELFYSLLLSAANLGAVLSGVTNGFLVRSVPYWYLWLIALIFNTIAFLIYSISYQGWLIMISRLLTGYFLGSIITLSFSYFTASSQAYIEVKKELGKETDKKAAIRLRNYLFAAMSIGYSVGLLIGSSATVIFAQFQSINQFRAMGWFNAVYGVVAICLQMVMFHGETKCKRTDQCFQYCPSVEKESSRRFGVLSLFIIISLLVLSFIERVRYSFVLTLLNPVASDSFGIDEREASYLFLALCVPQATGSVLLIILQRLKVSSQAIVLLAIISTMLGYLIVTDWQTIPYDPCTEYSPFHHPGIAWELNSSIGSNQNLHRTTRGLNILDSSEEISTSLPKLTGISLLSDIEIDLGTSTISYQVDNGVNFGCRHTETCECTNLPSKCLHFIVGENHSATYGIGIDQKAYKCSSDFNHESPIALCVFLYKQPATNTEADIVDVQSVRDKDSAYMIAKISEIDILPQELTEIAKENCIQANVTSHQCHWIPDSGIFKKECEDCQPICRSVRQTLTFAQFIIGNSLLTLSSALQIVPVVALLMNQTPEQIQGIVIGCMTAMNSISRTVAPILLDAAYEGIDKRVFLLSMILALVHIPFIIEISLLYPKLGPRVKPEDTGNSKGKHKYTKLDSCDKND